jgi:FecR protein
MHTSTHTLRTALLILVTALMSWAPADAESGRRAGIVTALQGTATVTRASLSTPRVLKFRDDVMLQDRIATGDQSVARILLGGKAVVTVRERSVVTIIESPNVSTIDVADGKIALAVAKERMHPGESIDVRTPNAVAGIRGTVVIAEVQRRGADVSTRFTLLTGVIDVMRLDAARQPVGAAAILNPLQTISIDRVLSPVRPITRAEGATASARFGIAPTLPTRGNADWIANDQVTQAVAVIDQDRGRGNDLRQDPKPDKGGKADRDDKPDKVKDAPVAMPPTPIVPASALQSAGGDKGNRGKGKDK